MAMNLRLSEEAQQALRVEAARSGRSQQEIVRDAVARRLHLVPERSADNDRDALIASGLVRPPRQPYRKVTPVISLPPDTTTLDLLNRDDRL